MAELSLTPTAPRRRRVAILAVLAAVGLGAAAWAVSRPPPPVIQKASAERRPGNELAEMTSLSLGQIDETFALTPDQAFKINASMPFVTGPNPEAAPFRLTGDPISHDRALNCLTMAVYYEAGFEAPGGGEAVAQVVLNRLRHPAYPKTVCGVVFQGSSLSTGCQFSFTCDGSISGTPSAAAWARAKRIATDALGGAVAKSVGLATHYHTLWVAPSWGRRLLKSKQLGAHVFYRWPGPWGLPSAFRERYAGSEPWDPMGGVEPELIMTSVVDPTAFPADSQPEAEALTADQTEQAPAVAVITEPRVLELKPDNDAMAEFQLSIIDPPKREPGELPRLAW